jgi:5-deoxy-glucuronate isomerase
MIHARALPNSLGPDQLRLRPPLGDVRLNVDPRRAGWRYQSFEVISLARGETFDLDRREEEALIVTVSGGGVVVEPETGTRISLEGRASVFEGLPWAAYLPRAVARIVGEPLDERAVIAIGQATRSERDGVSTAPIAIHPSDVPVEVRGAGNATRQVNHIVKPDFPADRLLCVEVLIPGGNWAGWPPHKHDVDDWPHEAVLEETYYFQLRRPEGWAVMRLYRKDGTRDAFWAVRHGELALVTDGYHPFAATPGYDAYFLNVLTGDRRTMANREDPDLAWVRATYAALTPDPRVPLVGPLVTA